MQNSFPFNIGDVARLCDIPIKKTKGNEYVDCPFCGKKKKLNINFDKNQYRCPRCNNGGSMLKLYSETTGFRGSNGEIVAKIKEELGIDSDTFIPQTKSQKADKDDTQNEELIVDFEKMKRWDKVYRAFLSKLHLGEIHRQKLLHDRYMDAKDVERFMFKSVPVFGYKYICQQLVDEGYNLNGVGGFYYDVDGWNIQMNPKVTGYIIPIWNYFGYIEGLQVRLDRPFNKYKYHLISSDGQKMGTKTPAVPFYVGGKRQSHTLFLTEGFFKAAIPNKIFGYNIMALPGVNNQKEFERLIPYLKKDGITKIKECFDSDYRTNKNVADAKALLKALVEENGFAYESFEWDSQMGKGIDDYAIYRLKEYVRCQKEQK